MNFSIGAVDCQLRYKCITIASAVSLGSPTKIDGDNIEGGRARREAVLERRITDQYSLSSPTFLDNSSLTSRQSTLPVWPMPYSSGR
ncbi:hypothetical protein NIES25_45620 [Nostoc linckia NIES-25]|nr:hypothetical protein NIES25_45620 [Nostoc linckia NIES-25]